jgi:hypothetical protein
MWLHAGPPNLKDMDVMFCKIHVSCETTSIHGETSSRLDDDDNKEVKETNNVQEVSPGTSSKKYKGKY